MALLNTPSPDSVADLTLIIKALDHYIHTVTALGPMGESDRLASVLIRAWYRGRLETLLNQVKR